jgi:hypothetical protein
LSERQIGSFVSFIQTGEDDDRLGPTHMSFLLALFCYWAMNNYKQSFNISRKAIMKLAKVKSTATYHKCIKEISDYGYITYIPSFHPLSGSLVMLNMKLN